MSVRQKDCQDMHFFTDEIPERTYSADPDVNILLNRYCELADENGIWFSIDAFGIHPELYGDGFCEILEMMLDTASEECIETISPGRRYMKLRSRQAHKRMFIQLTYSQGGETQKKQDQRVQEVEKRIRRKNGYYNYISTADEAIIRISVPDRQTDER